MKRIGWLMLGAMAPLSGQAQEAAPMAEARAAIETADLAALPPEVRAAIGRAYWATETVQIRGVEKVNGQTIAAKEMVFKKNSTIEFTGAHPWVLLFARRMRIEDPQSLLSIQRNMALLAGPKGQAGAIGAGGRKGKREGANGGPGGSGTDGRPGGTIAVPDIYIVAGRLEAINTPEQINQARIAVDFRGVPGGVGGAGGSGGKGGAGADGRNGRASWKVCKSGPGNGGNGGRGGSGGNGGAGGNGGHGGRVYVIGLPVVTDVFTAGDILTNGGAAGKGGGAGAAGAGGSHGSRGSRPGMCSGGSDGDAGKAGRAGQAGGNGQIGGRGSIYAFRLNALQSLETPPSP